MTLLQSAQTGRRVNVLENYFIRLFKYNNMIANEKTDLQLRLVCT
jgi:hypothetical protein